MIDSIYQIAGTFFVLVSFGLRAAKAESAALYFLVFGAFLHGMGGSF